jgi:predicted AAA+ superfamily ATPase
MIERSAKTELIKLLKEYQVVTVLGPRQSGKTTLAKAISAEYAYSNLEEPEVREFAFTDPKAYLAQFRGKVIIDEIQRVPELLSYIQVAVDESKQNGQYILTGSHQLQLQEAISQSLAGRTAVFRLMPLSIGELSAANIKYDSFSEYCIRGFYPRLYDQKMRPGVMYSNYYRTYVERDVRQLIQLKDLGLFEKFIALVAGRVGQIMDYSSLANDIGVDAKTVKRWLSTLEASFLIFKLNPYFENFGKRVIKAPKYYFSDTGLLCFLLGIEKESQLIRDPLVGSVFENLVVTEAYKARYNQGAMAKLYFIRDSNGNEIDLIYKKGRDLVAIEIKSASTFSSHQLKSLRKFRAVLPQNKESYLVYSGESKNLSDNYGVLNFKQAGSLFG